MRSLVALLALLASILATPVALAQPLPRVSAVEVDRTGDATHVTIWSDEPLKYKAFLDESKGRRVVVDLPLVRWSIGGLTAESGTRKGEGVVQSFRYTHTSPTSSRLVLEVSEPVSIQPGRPVSASKAGQAITLVLTPSRSPKGKVAAVSDPGDAKARKLVVIDAGHGGKDPGAISAGGTREKDLTLETAKSLAAALRKTGRYNVALTRDDDVYIELEDRVSRARDLGAALFISLHADAGGRPDLRGASVYTLSPDGEKRVEAARRKNDWVLAVETDTSRPTEVNQILADLVQRETKNQSARFAELLAPSLVEQGWPALQNTHRRRGFFVLLSPDVPAVLLEMGFLTNAQDEAMLKSPSERRKLVEGIVRAIDAFFGARPL